MRHAITTLEVEADLSVEQVSHLRQFLAQREEWQGEIRLITSQRAALAEVVATTAGVVGAICGLASLLIQLYKRVEDAKWSVERVTSVVREEAAISIGIAAVDRIRYEGLRGFLDRKQRMCKVIVHVADSDYAFYLWRDGACVGLRLE